MRSLQIYLFFSLIQFSQEFTTSSGPLAANIFNGPPLPERNFIPIWNSPTYSCQEWNISLNLSQYGIVANDENNWYGKFMNMFYSNVGLWPYYDHDDEDLPVNNGLPQLGDLDSHLNKLEQDIKTVIPDEDFQGMAVLDFEYWRPVFDRNWGDKSIYRDQSMLLVYKEHPSWRIDQIIKEARIQFESAAKRYMQSSILLGRKLRPKALWGYYGFPRCYNNYTSECSNVTKELNDEITWLFESSSVVLPSIYIYVKSDYSQDYAKGNILEGLRMSNLSTGQRLPVFPYVRVVYCALSHIFLNKQDIYSTVSQSAELATSGVVIWGAHADKTEEFCLQLKDYVDDFFGPLVVTLSRVTQECASEYCSSHGRCRFKLQPVVTYVKDVLLDLSLKKEWSFVECVCDMGWKGGHCGTPSL